MSAEDLNFHRHIQSGYRHSRIKQLFGYWNERNTWVLENETHKPPLRRSFSDVLALLDDISEQSRSDCPYLSLDVDIRQLSDRHYNFHDPNMTSVHFTPQLRLSDAVRGIDQTCAELPFVTFDHRLDFCRLFLLTMYQELTQSTFCAFYTPFHARPLPLTIQYEENFCGEPIWCNHTMEMQSRLEDWQNPITSLPLKPYFSERQMLGCEGAKFLLYEPNYDHPKGIPGVILEIAFLLRFAICHGRILYLTPLHLMKNSYFHTKNTLPSYCSSSLLECTFQTISPCVLSDYEILNAPILRDDRQLNAYPLRESRVVRLIRFPTKSHCSSCKMSWTGNVEIFDGLHIGLLGYVLTSSDGIIETTILDILNQDTKQMSSFSSYMGSHSVFWMSEMVRYVLRPRNWFGLLLREYIRNHLLVSPFSELLYPQEIGQAYASIHFEMNDISVDRDPLQSYLRILQYYEPHIKHIFLSTNVSSQDIFESLVR